MTHGVGNPLSWAPSLPCSSQGISSVCPGWIQVTSASAASSLPLSNTSSILVETARQQRLLSALLLLSCPCFWAEVGPLLPRGGSPFVLGSGWLPVPGRAVGRAMGRAGSRCSAICSLAAIRLRGAEAASRPRSFPHVCLRPAPEACSLPPRLGWGSCSCFASRCQVWKEFVAC